MIKNTEPRCHLSTAFKERIQEMKQEKSCGAIVYRHVSEKTQLLLIKHRFSGHWSFPKGHVEEGEHENETALREVKEETGLDILLQKGFRESVEYCPSPDVKKQVVYFLGVPSGGALCKQDSEVSDIRWLEIGRAQREVTFNNDKMLIRKVSRHLSEGKRAGAARHAPKRGSVQP
jgi:bis(5'-nucleosidyl)-tetraphosphatase